MTSSHRNFSGVECCLHTNRLRVFTTRLGGRNNTNSIFSYMTRVILKMLIVLYVYVFIILHLFFCPASNFNTCLLVIIKFFSDLYTRILVYGLYKYLYPNVVIIISLKGVVFISYFLVFVTLSVLTSILESWFVCIFSKRYY